MEFIYGSTKVEPLFIAEETFSYLNREIALDMNRIVKRLFQSTNQGVRDLFWSVTNFCFHSLELIEWETENIIKGKIREVHVEAFYRTEPRDCRDSVITIRPDFYEEVITDIYSSLHKRGNDDKHSQESHTTPLDFPSPILLLLEEKRELPKKIVIYVGGGERDAYPFTVPILNLSSFSPSELVDEDLYLLLPLQVISLRRRLEEIQYKEIDEKERLSLFKESREDLIRLVKEIARELNRIFKEKEIHIKEIGSMYAIMGSIVEGYAELFRELKGVKGEVHQIIGSSFDELIEELF